MKMVLVRNVFATSFSRDNGAVITSCVIWDMEWDRICPIRSYFEIHSPDCLFAIQFDHLNNVSTILDTFMFYSAFAPIRPHCPHNVIFWNPFPRLLICHTMATIYITFHQVRYFHVLYYYEICWRQTDWVNDFMTRYTYVIACVHQCHKTVHNIVIEICEKHILYCMFWYTKTFTKWLPIL